MNFNLFFDSSENLNKNISANPDKKEEVYNILVEHNKKAEINFLKRLNKTLI